jgi:glycine cleavage system aminomethyltransferase T
VGKSVAYGFVPSELAKETSFEIEAFGQRHAATRSAKAPYDPDRRKIVNC